MPQRPAPTDDSGFQPIPSRSTSLTARGPPSRPPPPVFDISFKPRADLYAKGNDAALLLRDLSRLGELSIYCDTSSLADARGSRAEAAYLSWK